MSTLEKMQVLSDFAQYDLCDKVTSYSNTSQINLPGIYQATGANGCQIPIFKTLMSNKCKNDCKYCINQHNNKFTRMELSPEELSKVFLHYYNNNYVDGLFLSSGISHDVDDTMEKVIETSRILRKDYGYQDYIHLKIIPGASKDSIKRAMELADRVSINVEAATKSGLDEISSTKDYNKDILKRIDWIRQIQKRNPKFIPSGHTTQFIIGANDESDLEVLKRVDELYKKSNLQASYFSPFNPIEGTELEKKPECRKERTNQLYHANALVGDYHFKVDELVFDENDQLHLDEDPKILAAREMDIFPVEINSAPYVHLIRVPGIGPKSAGRIMNIRKKIPFTKLEELQRIGVVVKRAEPYIKLGGKYQTALDDLFH